MADGDKPNGDAMAASLLTDTAALIDDDRDTHGDAVVNQEHIASGWAWYLHGKGVIDSGETITGDDVAAMMGILKMSRHAVGTEDMDHMRDIAGYAGIGGACLVSRGVSDEEQIKRGAYEGAHIDE